MTLLTLGAGGVTIDGIRARSCDHRLGHESCISYSCL